jgi:molecular chaperone Hsp33
MNKIHASRGVSAATPDDIVLPFEIKPLGVRGRLLRLGAVIDGIVHQHAYPDAVSALLAESVALAAMLGTTMKFEGKFILQTATDGPVDMLVAQFATPSGLRGYARYDGEAVQAAAPTGRVQPDRLLGKGHLAMTVDQGGKMDRYQGIVALDRGGLVGAAHQYFRQSEQIPTWLKVAAGPLMARGAGPDRWRAGAILIQHLPAEGGASPMPLSSGDAPSGHEEEVPEDERWVRARVLAETVEDHELLDPLLAPERLLYRLFHEDGVTVYPPIQLERRCGCTRERVADMLRSFSEADRRHMVQQGRIGVTCQFCSARYEFSPDEVAAA